MGTKTMKAVELVMDWNLWPRCEAGDLDVTNLRRIKEAIAAGVKMPPVIANKADYRIVDGFHRTRAVLSLFGDDADIDVELREYGNESEIFLESMRLNAQHGMPLNSKDRAHALIKARKLKIPIAVAAEALAMEKTKAQDFLKKRSAKTKDGETIAIPYSAVALAGKTLTETQEHYVRHSNGTIPIVRARMLLASLRADAFVMDEQTVAVLTELHKKLSEILEGVAA